MSIKKREYLLSINDYKTPSKLEGDMAVGLLLVRIIMMEPGSDPLHPTMGLGIKKYRYGINNLEQLRSDCQYQIDTFLPCFPDATVNIALTKDRICIIEITIEDTVYVYDTEQQSTPVRLNDIKSN